MEFQKAVIHKTILDYSIELRRSREPSLFNYKQLCHMLTVGFEMIAYFGLESNIVCCLMHDINLSIIGKTQTYPKDFMFSFTLLSVKYRMIYERIYNMLYQNIVNK